MNFSRTAVRLSLAAVFAATPLTTMVLPAALVAVTTPSVSAAPVSGTIYVNVKRKDKKNKTINADRAPVTLRASNGTAIATFIADKSGNVTFPTLGEGRYIVDSEWEGRRDVEYVTLTNKKPVKRINLYLK